MDIEIIKIILAYSLAAVFIFTAVATSLSLIGIVKFAEVDQQKTLFKILIVELVVVVIGFFGKALEFDTSAAKDKIVTSALSDKRKSFSEKLTAARTEYEKGNLPKAYELTNKLFKSDELSEYIPIRDLFILNGDISMKREFWLEAVESYGPALKLDPNNIDLLVNSGDVQRQLKNYEAAEKMYDRAFSLQSQNWKVLSGYFNCVRRYAAFLSDEYPKIAEIKFQKAAELSRQMKTISTDAQQQKLSDIAKGRLYWEWKKYDVAFVTYQQLVSQYPNEKAFKEDMASILVEMQKFDEAKALFADLYETEKTNNSIGWFVGAGYAEAASKSHSTIEELSAALEAGLLAISIKPDEPFSYYAVALAYKSLGNKEQAITYLKLAEAKEASRDTNIHTYDKTRHSLYKKTISEWEKT